MTQSTRERMVIAGERLIAERGLESLSLREVHAVAGQRNKSAAHYHFGSKMGLVEAIFEHRFAPINQSIAERLTDLDKDPLPPDLRSLVAALVQPLADVLGHNAPTWHARFLARLHTDPELAARLSGGAKTRGRGPLELPAVREVLDRIAPFLVDIPPAIRAERQGLVFGFLVGALAGRESAIQLGSSTPAAIPLLRGDLVDMAVAMLEAPVSRATAAKLRPQRPRVRSGAANARSRGARGREAGRRPGASSKRV